jgi:hypothetical protein
MKKVFSGTKEEVKREIAAFLAENLIEKEWYHYEIILEIIENNNEEL